MRIAALVWLAAALFASPASAIANTVALLLSGEGGSYAEVTEAIQAEVRRVPGSRIVVAVAGTPAADELAQAGPRLLVTVGTLAAQVALRNGDPRLPLLCVLIPRLSFESMLAATRAAEARAAGEPRRVSALFLDQPPARQLELIRQALPGLLRVGLVLGPDAARDLERLQAAAQARGLKLAVEQIARDTELFPALQRVMQDSDVFLALPDPRVINADTAQNVLLTSFRMRRPVVGYSAAYVRAGALAAVYSTPQQIGTQTGQILRAILGGSPLPAPQFPKQFSVSVNHKVARSMGVELDDDDVIRSRIAREERE
jgi:ABC-type uncharacterized transport system substrate-binding protein